MPRDKCQQPANECHFNSLMHGKCLKAVLPLLWLFGMTSNLHIFPQNSRKHTFCVKFQIMALCSWLLWAISYQWDGPVARLLVPLECVIVCNVCVCVCDCVCVCVCQLWVQMKLLSWGETCLLHYQRDTFYFLNLTLRLSSVIYEIGLCVCVLSCVCVFVRVYPYVFIVCKVCTGSRG